MIFCMVLCMLPVCASADDGEQSVRIDAGSGTTTTDDYTITDSEIRLLNPDKTYELTGNTDRNVMIPAGTDAGAARTFRLQLKGVRIGDITSEDKDNTKLVVEIPKDTVSSVGSLYAANLTVNGAGTLNAASIGVTPAGDGSKASVNGLSITDTTIKVRMTDKCSTWAGKCVIAGSADVTFIGNGDDTPLQLGKDLDDRTHSLTIQDNAKLRCRLETDKTLSTAVNGIDIYGDSTQLTLKDNARLEAQSLQGENNENGGIGLHTMGFVLVQDKAVIDALGRDRGVYMENHDESLKDSTLIVDGGSVIAKSITDRGLSVSNKITIRNGAYVEVEGGGYNTSGLYTWLGITVENSTVKSTSNNGIPISSNKGTAQLTDSVIYLATKEESLSGNGILCLKEINASSCWIVSTERGVSNYVPDESISNSVQFEDLNEGIVYGDAVIPADVTIEEGMELEIPEGTSLTIPAGMTLTNKGKIIIKGKLINKGRIILDGGTLERNGEIDCTGHAGGTATCTKQAVCEICLNPYGDKDTDNHTGKKIWVSDEKSHTQKWDCCDSVVIAQEDHEWADGKCSECGYVCSHKGGTATCTRQAECELCDMLYGDLAPGNHTDLRHTDARKATANSDGNIEYWYCSGCGRYYSNADASKEITEADTVIPKPEDNGKSSKTGDNSRLALWLVLLTLSGGTTLTVTIVNRKRKHTGR